MMETGLQLQDRDREILEALGEWGPLDADTLARRWFTSRDKCRKRMSRLITEGYCRRMLVARNVPTVYFVGAFTAQTLHRVAVNAVRVELSECGTLLDFDAEVEFAGSQHRSDALVTWQPAGASESLTFFLEVDRGTETVVQIREKLRAYCDYFRSLRWQRLWREFPPTVWVAQGRRLEQLRRWVEKAQVPTGVHSVFGLTSLITHGPPRLTNQGPNLPVREG